MNCFKSFAVGICCLLSVATYEVKSFSLIDGIGHLRAFINNPEKVGAIAPCSDSVGEEVVTYIKQHIASGGAPLRILEVGAGTGVLTSKIIEVLNGDGRGEAKGTVDVVEILPESCDVLYAKFAGYANVSIHCISVTDWHPAYKYDFIVSTLPFYLLEPAFIQQVFNHYLELMIPRGILSYVSYAVIPEIKAVCLWGERKKIHRQRMAIVKKFRDQYGIAKRTIVNNIPPINIYHLRLV